MGKQYTREVGVPVSLGVANAEGTAKDRARRDHIHQRSIGQILVYGLPDDGTVLGSYFRGTDLADCGDTNAFFKFRVPSDFTTLLFAVVVVVPGGSGNMRCNWHSTYGGCGQVYTTHQQSQGNHLEAVTLNEYECIDVSNVLTLLAAGDIVGLRFNRDCNIDDTVDALVTALMFYAEYR